MVNVRVIKQRLAGGVLGRRRRRGGSRTQWLKGVEQDLKELIVFNLKNVTQ